MAKAGKKRNGPLAPLKMSAMTLSALSGLSIIFAIVCLGVNKVIKIEIINSDPAYVEMLSDQGINALNPPSGAKVGAVFEILCIILQVATILASFFTIKKVEKLFAIATLAICVAASICALIGCIGLYVGVNESIPLCDETVARANNLTCSSAASPPMSIVTLVFSVVTAVMSGAFYKMSLNVIKARDEKTDSSNKIENGNSDEKNKKDSDSDTASTIDGAEDTKHKTSPEAAIVGSPQTSNFNNNPYNQQQQLFENVGYDMKVNSAYPGINEAELMRKEELMRPSHLLHDAESLSLNPPPLPPQNPDFRPMTTPKAPPPPPPPAPPQSKQVYDDFDDAASSHSNTHKEITLAPPTVKPSSIGNMNSFVAEADFDDVPFVARETPVQF